LIKEKFDPQTIHNSSVAKIWEGLNILTLSEQQYLVWDTASQRTKQQDKLEI